MIRKKNVYKVEFLWYFCQACTHEEIYAYYNKSPKRKLKREIQNQGQKICICEKKICTFYSLFPPTFLYFLNTCVSSNFLSYILLIIYYITLFFVLLLPSLLYYIIITKKNLYTREKIKNFTLNSTNYASIRKLLIEKSA